MTPPRRPGRTLSPRTPCKTAVLTAVAEIARNVPLGARQWDLVHPQVQLLQLIVVQQRRGRHGVQLIVHRATARHTNTRAREVWAVWVRQRKPRRARDSNSRIAQRGSRRRHGGRRGKAAAAGGTSAGVGVSAANSARSRLVGCNAKPGASPGLEARLAKRPAPCSPRSYTCFKAGQPLAPNNPHRHGGRPRSPPRHRQRPATGTATPTASRRRHGRLAAHHHA